MQLQAYGADMMDDGGLGLAGGGGGTTGAVAGAKPPLPSGGAVLFTGPKTVEYALPAGATEIAATPKGTPLTDTTCGGGSCPAVTPPTPGATPGNTSVPVTALPVLKLASTAAAPQVTGAQPAAITAPTAGGVPVWVWVVAAIVGALFLFRS